jgi:hypothetical protein
MLYTIVWNTSCYGHTLLYDNHFDLINIVDRIDEINLFTMSLPLKAGIYEFLVMYPFVTQMFSYLWVGYKWDK